MSPTNSNDEELQSRIEQIKEQLPTPVIWLLGKTQSGKTSIIRALTGRSDAEIGNGFQACTDTARSYDFPSPEDCIIRFLDTRGIGEVSYDPAEDMRLFMQQAHVLLVVVKAMDHALEDILKALRTIRKSHPNWPIVVVQTTLHEAYQTPTAAHIEPYPFRSEPWPGPIPDDLARSLRKQREVFKAFNVEFAAVDFTLPEDGFSPVYYGAETLWDAIEKALPRGLCAILKASAHGNAIEDIYLNAAHRHIIAYALMAASAELVPLPALSVPLVLSLQGKMLHTIASIYHREVDRQIYTEIGGALGLGYVLRWGGRELLKLIPVYGTAVTAAYVAAVTYALGKAVCHYFRLLDGGERPHHAIIRRIYAEELQRGRELLAQYINTLYRKGD